MKTIDSILEVVEVLNGSCYELNISMFRVCAFNTPVIYFEIRFKPSHIENLKRIGISIDFGSVRMAELSENDLRFKAGREAIKQGDYATYFFKDDPAHRQRGEIENWLIAKACCNVESLKEINKYCRYNHLHHVAIDNDYMLREAGWNFGKGKYSPHVNIASQYLNIKAIRRTVKGRKASELLPIQKRVLGLK